MTFCSYIRPPKTSLYWFRSQLERALVTKYSSMKGKVLWSQLELLWCRHGLYHLAPMHCPEPSSRIKSSTNLSSYMSYEGFIPKFPSHSKELLRVMDNRLLRIHKKVEHRPPPVERTEPLWMLGLVMCSMCMPFFPHPDIDSFCVSSGTPRAFTRCINQAHDTV